MSALRRDVQPHLKPTAEPAKPRRGLARSGRLRFRSRRTAKIYRELRVPLVARLLAERAWCELRVVGVCTGRAVCVHELVKRSAGGSIIDEANCMTSCALCNGWVEDHPAEARALGLSNRAAA